MWYYVDMTRVELFGVDSFVHVVKRGARGMPITGDKEDRFRFLKLLYYMNDEYLDMNWYRIDRRDLFFRPESWPKRKPLVAILAYTLMPNHLHLLLKEIREGGVTGFMQKLGQSMTNHHNEKYDEKGSIFQGAYRGRTIDSDEYLRYVAAYIMVKNVFELYPKGGLRGATEGFEDAWKWGTSYRFSSLGDYAGTNQLPILERGMIADVFSSVREFKNFARDVIDGGKWPEKDVE